MKEFLTIIGGILFLAACVSLWLVCAVAGLFTGMWFWWTGLRAALQLPGPENTAPAEPLYLHHRAWFDLEQTAGLGWAQMETMVKEWFAWKVSPAGIGLGMGACIGTMVCLGVFSLFHGFGIALCAFVSYIAQCLLQLVEMLRIIVLRLSPPCHNCNRPYSTPIFLCNQCGVEHPALVPGRFGYTYHRCRCGWILAAVSWNQESPMIALCPKPRCRQPVDPSRRMPICIALAGGPSQGKTHLLIRAVQDLLLRTVEAQWVVKPNQETDQKTIDALLRQHERGTVDKTLIDVPRALNLRICFHDAGPERLLYLYDPGGEAFQPRGNLSQHPYYAYADALIFAIDPFALPQLADAHASVLDAHRQELRPGDFHPAEAFTNFKNTLWSVQKLSLKAICPLPLSVVLTKMDAEEMLELLATMPGNNTSDRCNQFLRHAGQAELVDLIERSFTTFRFFALGEFGPGVSSVDAERSGDVLAWAIRHQRLSSWGKLLRWMRN
jgi:hypothetical protein